MRPFRAVAAALMLIAGCSVETRVDWPDYLGGGKDESDSPAAKVEQVDRVSVIEAVEIGQSHRGVIVTATGLAPFQGFWRPELRLLNDGRPAADGAIELELVARPPEVTDLAPADPATRRLIAAQYVPQDLLRAGRAIRVLATENAVARPL